MVQAPQGSRAVRGSVVTDLIPYMGTKRELSAAVLEATQSCRTGAVVDLFAGMGSVAAAHEQIRPVWANDVQHFAYLNNKCRLTGQNPNSSSLLNAANEALFKGNMAAIAEQSKPAYRALKEAEAASEYDSFASALSRSTDEFEEVSNAFCCFTNRYSGSYFSLLQCAEIDSIRCLLENARGFGRVGTNDFDWGLLCLGAAMLRCANTTGHFAQYLKPNQGNWRRIQRQYRKSVWEAWKSALKQLKPFGEQAWRQKNRVSRLDALEALEKAEVTDLGVVYCDPPYTNDQYSRFYHLWETLVLYDYPITTGNGLYRSNRFATGFSHVRGVSAAFEQLVSQVAAAGADIVLSYPSNGLLHDAGNDPLEIIRQHFSSATLRKEISYGHSSMGASKGMQKNIVFERIYVGQNG